MEKVIKFSHLVKGEKIFALILNGKEFIAPMIQTYTGNDVEAWLTDNNIDLESCGLIYGIGFKDREIKSIADMQVGDMVVLDTIEVVYLTRLM